MAVCMFHLSHGGGLTLTHDDSQVNEFEVTLQWPGAGLATGSGTVGGARVLPMEEVTRSMFSVQSLYMFGTKPMSAVGIKRRRIAFSRINRYFLRNLSLSAVYLRNFCINEIMTILK